MNMDEIAEHLLNVITRGIQNHTVTLTDIELDAMNSARKVIRMQ